MKKLKDVIPYEFFEEYMDTPAAKHLEKNVVKEYQFSWPGKHKNVVCWWKLEDNTAVGWNENVARGWSFPVIKLKNNLS